MRAIGVDPASRKTGVAVVDRQPDAKAELLFSEVWRAGKEVTPGLNLLALQAYLTRLCLDYEVTRGVVERVSVSMNLDTVRKIQSR